MLLTATETKKAEALIPNEIVAIQVQNERGDYYNILVGDGLSSRYFAYAEEIDQEREGDDEPPFEPNEPENGEGCLEILLNSKLMMAEGSLEFKRDFVISPLETIAYLDGDITYTQTGVDKWLKQEGWLPRRENTRPVIERVKLK